MFRFLRYYIRSLLKRRSLSFITIGGYAISMAVLLILGSFIVSEKNYNREFENKENIYRIVRSDNEALVPSTLQDDIRKKVPGIKKMSLYNIESRLYKNNEKLEIANFIATDDDFLDIFSFHFIYKSEDPTLAVKNNIILTKSLSEKLFGNNNPVGQNFEIQDKPPYTIVGVVSDIPKSATFQFDALLNKDLMPASKKLYSNSEEHILYGSFVLLEQGVNKNDINQQLSGMINHWKVFSKDSLSLEALERVYFHVLPYDRLQHANVKLMYLLSSIALIVFLMTIINYSNLSISTGYERLTEIGIKKTTGAGKGHIFRQVLAEALFISLLSMIFAVLITYLIAPLFSNILSKDVNISSLFNQPLALLAGVLLFLITGIVSGIYPAISLSGISPIQSISFQKTPLRNHRRGGVVVLQFVITMVLIVSMLMIKKQLDFVKYADMGFDKELLVRLNLTGQDAISKSKVLKEELLKNPNIVSISASIGSPMSNNGSIASTFNVFGEQKYIQVSNMDADGDFVETFDLKIIKGRNLNSSDVNACLINEHLFKELEWKEIDNKTLYGSNVVGVVKDFHYENLYTPIGNLQLILENNYANILNIKLKGNIAESLDYIEKTFRDISPDTPFSFMFYDEWIQSMYKKEEEQAKAVGLFALLAIIISCLGLVGIVEQTIHKKVKEIGVRKINGARISEILELLNIDFIKWVILAYIIAMPIAFYIMRKWLENFAYKTNLSWWTFALAGIVTLGIALLTVSWQSWRAARRNPVEALRYE